MESITLREYLLELKAGYGREIALAITVCLLVFWFVVSDRKKRNYPPGPSGLPIVGYMPFLDQENLHLNFINLGRKYGEVFSFRFGSQDVVVLHSAEAIKEAFSKNEFLGRPVSGMLEKTLPYSPFFAGNIFSWVEHRRFVVHAMKDLGLGKSKTEDNIKEEVHELLECIRKSNGEPIDLKKPLSPSMSNNITALVFGSRLEYDDPDRVYLDKHLDDFAEYASTTDAYTAFPWAKYIPFSRKLFAIDKAIKATTRLRDFFLKEIQKHKETFDNRHLRDFIDSYIDEMNVRREKDPATTFNEDALVDTVIDLFAAGSETVRTSILWTVLYLAKHLEVQQKVQKEIYEVLGAEAEPEYSDIKRTPYTHAVIMETMRLRTTAPLGVNRCTVEDTSVCGYGVPKGVLVIPNLWNVHHDPKYWGDPEVFRPERFLNEDRSSVVKSKYYMPFSLGRRVCPGEAMANIEIFLYLVSLLQKFDIFLPEGQPEPGLGGRLAIVYRTNHYLVRFVPK